MVVKFYRADNLSQDCAVRVGENIYLEPRLCDTKTFALNPLSNPTRLNTVQAEIRKAYVSQDSVEVSLRAES